jgi:hypothetical protein
MPAPDRTPFYIASLNGLIKLRFLAVELVLVDDLTPPKPADVVGLDIYPCVDAMVFFVRLLAAANAFWGETLAKSDVLSELMPRIPAPAEMMESLGLTIWLLVLSTSLGFRFI